MKISIVLEKRIPINDNLMIKKTLQKISRFVKLFIPNQLLDRYYSFVVRRRTYAKWRAEGCPIPAPDLVKYRIIDDYRKKYKLKKLVETGTYLGYMITYHRKNFNEIHTGELMEKYYKEIETK